MSTTPALSLPSAGDAFETTTIERRDLRPDDVRIEIHYAGICHTDLHYGHDDWGNAFFPMTPGHEIAGVVTEVGAEVTKHAVGDRVGIGCISNSCQQCDQCDDGQEQFCRKGMVMTYSTEDYDGTITKGGYSRSTVVGERYAVKIPDGLGLDAAAPLLCAGITMFSPLRHWQAGPDKRIAIIGMGGLGHVGVKLAAAMGAKVTVLSQTLSKEDDGKRFGAAAYYATEDEKTFEELAGSFDLILNTVSADLPLDKYLSLLDVDGTLVEVGAPGQPQSFGVFSLLAKRASLAGTSIGGMPETQEMLDFCAEHGVEPEIETIQPTPDAVREAWHRIADSKARYRVVIDVAGLENG